MRVCFISSFYPPLVFGGAEIYVQRISEKLVQRGIGVTVITTGRSISLTPAVEMVNGVKVYRVHPLNIYPIYDTLSKTGFLKPFWYGIDLLNPHSYFVIRNILGKEKPDIVHVHNFKGFSYAFRAAKSLRLPLVFTVHDYFLECPRETLFRGPGRICEAPSPGCRLYRGIQGPLKDNIPDVVTAPSQFVIDRLHHDGFFRRTRTMKLPLGIDPAVGESPDRATEAIRLLFVGRLNASKGVGVLIRAFREMECGNGERPVRLDIVGDGPDRDALRKAAEGCGGITFRGFVSEEELRGYYRRAHLVIVPSLWYETFGLVILESFRHGTPVVASRIGGFPELVRNGENGRLFEAGNAAELAGILGSLTRDPEEMRRMGERAIRTAGEYGMDLHLERLTALYGEILGH